MLGLDVTVAPPGPADARAQLQAITSAIALLATDPQAAASGTVVEVGRLLAGRGAGLTRRGGTSGARVRCRRRSPRLVPASGHPLFRSGPGQIAARG